MVIFYSYINVYQRVNHLSCVINITLPILDTLQKITIFLLVNVDILIDTKRLVRISLCPSKIDLDYLYYIIMIPLSQQPVVKRQPPTARNRWFTSK